MYYIPSIIIGLWLLVFVYAFGRMYYAQYQDRKYRLNVIHTRYWTAVERSNVLHAYFKNEEKYR